jgi:cell division protein FtsN
MAKRKRSRKTTATGASSFIWMSFGLSVGLVVAAAVYISDRRAPAADVPARSDSVASSPTVTVVPSAESAAAEEPHPASRFDFYDMLPKFEVVLPEVESQASPDREAVSVGEPGSYVIQAGSFKAQDDAERMRATLALLGVESRLQRVSIDDDVYHRVRIGPTSDLNKLNGVRRRLWDAEIEVLLIKVPD